MNETEQNLQIGPVPRVGQADALRLIFAHLGEFDCNQLVSNLLAGSAANVVALSGLYEARRDGALAGAVWAQLQPGATACLWPPGLASGELDGVALALIESAGKYLHANGVSMAQAMLTAKQTDTAKRLESAGFSQLATLSYLVAMESSFPRTPPADLDFETFSATNRERFEETIERTYLQTLDCPKLNGVREIGDVLDGYRSTGVFAERWMLIREKEQDIGCLILSDRPGPDIGSSCTWASYPRREVAAWACELCDLGSGWRGLRRGRMVLAVDRDNEPAISMYTRAGFMPWDERTVYLRVFSE